MSEIKSRFSKRLTGIVRKIFIRRVNKTKSPRAVKRHSMSPWERTSVTECAVWRQNVEQLCWDYDGQLPTGRNEGDVVLISPNSDTFNNLRLQTRVYRDQLKDLKTEARLLKRYRDGLCREMQNIVIERDIGRRRSVAISKFAR